MSPSARVKHETIYNVGHLISGFSSVKAVRLLLLFWITICCVSILITFYVTCTLGAERTVSNETVLLSTQNLCFSRKILFYTE